MKYWCLFKRSFQFKWGSLYPEARPHLEKKFNSQQEAEQYLATQVPGHIREHLLVTEGMDI